MRLLTPLVMQVAAAGECFGFVACREPLLGQMPEPQIVGRARAESRRLQQPALATSSLPVLSGRTRGSPPRLSFWFFALRTPSWRIRGESSLAIAVAHRDNSALIVGRDNYVASSERIDMLVASKGTDERSHRLARHQIADATPTVVVAFTKGRYDRYQAR
jgi:hypothetical protein